MNGIRRFRTFILKLSKEFKESDLNNLKFILEGTIASGEIENLNTLDVFKKLQERNIIGPEKLDNLRNLIEAIDNPKLLMKIEKFIDSESPYPLKPKSENHLEMDGYKVEIKGGRHFETTEGEYVEIQSGANYGLTIANTNSHRCLCNIKIDGNEMFPRGFLLQPKQEHTIGRPARLRKKFKFFSIFDAPKGSGINDFRTNPNGVIKVVFTPEKADMKITCVAQGTGTQQLSCSKEITDSDFNQMVSTSFGADSVTITHKCKPLGKRGVKLLDYGLRDGSRVYVNLGGRGGVDIKQSVSNIQRSVSKKNVKWRAGGTTLEGDCEQEFGNGDLFPLDPTLAVSLNLRLVVHQDVIPIPSTGECTPLAKATVIPPPVPN